MKGSRDTSPRLTRVTRTTRGADTAVPHRATAADTSVSRGLSFTVSEAGVGRARGSDVVRGVYDLVRSISHAAKHRRWKRIRSTHGAAPADVTCSSYST